MIGLVRQSCRLLSRRHRTPRYVVAASANGHGSRRMDSHAASSSKVHQSSTPLPSCCSVTLLPSPGELSCSAVNPRCGPAGAGRFTRGIRVSVDHLASGAPGSSRWIDHFRTEYYDKGLCTAPCQLCPFCFVDDVLRCTHQQRRRASLRFSHRSGRSLASRMPCVRETCATQLPGSSSLAHKCNLAWHDMTYYAPSALSQHMSWCHPHRGYTAQELKLYNDHVLDHLVPRFSLQRAACRPSQHALATKQGNATWRVSGPGASVRRSSSPSSGLDRVLHCHSSRPEQGCAARLQSAFRLILLVDVANIELCTSHFLLDCMQMTEARALFQAVPVAVCCVHELFIPSTARTVHACYQLAQMHPDSDFYTFYAATRLESGDLLSSALVGAMRLRAKETCPPVMLMTMDSHQRMCMTELYGGVATSTTVVAHGSVHALRLSSAQAIVRCLMSVIESSFSTM